MFQDVRFALRVLAKKPVFTIIVAITLGLGIGSNTAIFSVADAFLLKPVNFESVERMMMVLERAPAQKDETNVSPANYLDWKKQNRSFDRIVAWEWVNINLTGEHEPEMAVGFRVSSDFFQTLGVRPMLGRPFLAEEEVPGRDQVVVLGYGLWERRYAGDRGIVGRTIQLNGKSFTVVGVTAKGFDFPLPSQLWIPLAMDAQEKSLRTAHSLEVMGRLKPGVSQEQALAEMETIASGLQAAYPASNKGWGIWMKPLRIYISGNLTREYTLLLLGAVGFVLLIACANVANLQFARAAGRQREIALRTALGASRWRVVRQLLVESVILSLAGAVIGIFLGNWGIEMIRGNMPPDVARFISGWKEIRLDVRTFAFTMAVAIIAGVLSGLVPALQGSRPDLNETLKEGGRGSTAAYARGRLRSVLLVGEIALALVLLVGAGLMVRGTNALLDVNRTFAPESLLTMRFELPESKYRDAPSRRAFYDEALRQVEAIPRVESATISTNVPYGNGGSTRTFNIEGKPAAEANEHRVVHMQTINTNYFQAMHVRLRDGREFSARDGADAPPVAIISERLARRYWGSQTPLGSRIKVGLQETQDRWLTIVGVVEDVREEWIERDPVPALYLPYPQAPRNHTYFSVRCAGDPAQFVASVRAAIAKADPDLPLSNIKTLERVMKESIVGLTYVAVMMTVLGAIALVLACVGVYGMMSYAVAERTHEIGIRMALGASRHQVLQLVVGRGALITGIGLSIGLGLSIMMARLLSGLIFGVSAMDWATFGGVSFALTAAAITASYIPARRATRVDPVIALRHD